MVCRLTPSAVVTTVWSRESDLAAEIAATVRASISCADGAGPAGAGPAVRCRLPARWPLRLLLLRVRPRGAQRYSAAEQVGASVQRPARLSANSRNSCSRLLIAASFGVSCVLDASARPGG